MAMMEMMEMGVVQAAEDMAKKEGQDKEGGLEVQKKKKVKQDNQQQKKVKAEQ
eukprot:COSAG04_NODE_3891_length_2445_cov_3.224638_3_plen_53_part_00